MGGFGVGGEVRGSGDSGRCNLLPGAGPERERMKLGGTSPPRPYHHPLPAPPTHTSHSFPSRSQSHLLSLKAAGGANMYVMNISSPERGFAGEL